MSEEKRKMIERNIKESRARKKSQKEPNPYLVEEHVLDPNRGPKSPEEYAAAYPKYTNEWYVATHVKPYEERVRE